ncbi:MAG: hypothetical protein LIO86_11705 [Lachnospiraceae bacterium]|nr:hypothetical protein [Lachnospiraceae bacterium]
MNEQKNSSSVMSEQEKEELYEKEYIPKVHRFGTFSMFLILILSFIPALYFSFALDFHPGWSVIGQAAVTMVGIEIFTWILEPTVYFPMIGITGSYISFVAGNITNMRIPAATAAQAAIGTKIGTRKNEFAGVIGIVASVIVNFVVLIVVILGGNFLLSILPDVVVDSLSYALPSVYGALLVTFAARLKR